MKTIRIGAHRGAMAYQPENTLAAFETAIRQGAYRIEFDIRRTRDGHLVVIHDETVDRTTDGQGRVADLTLSELKRLRSGNEEIPTLDEAISCMRNRARLLVEFKEEDIAEQAVRQVEAAGVVEQCILSSFHEGALLESRTLNRELEIAYFLVEPKPFDAAEIVERFGAGLLIVWPAAASSQCLADARAHGLDVRCGFRDSLTYEETREYLRALYALGVSEFSCGRPDWIGQIISELEE